MPRRQLDPRRSLTSADRASSMYAELVANTNDYYSGRIPYAEFHRRQLGIWDRIQQAGVHEQVLRRLREDLTRAQPRERRGASPSQRRVEQEIRAVTRRDVPARPRR